MYGNTVVQGIVIKSINIGEFDKRITILTRDRGKIGAFVRGARRPTYGCFKIIFFWRIYSL